MGLGLMRYLDRPPGVLLGRLTHAILLACLVLTPLNAAAAASVARLPAEPVVEVHVAPSPAYAGVDLRGSAVFSDEAGNREGASTFQWMVNGTVVRSGELPQTTRLPMDGSLLSADGRQPVEDTGLEFVAGRYDEAVQFTSENQSELQYGTIGVLDPYEGTIELWVKLDDDLAGLGQSLRPRIFSYVIDNNNQLYVEINSGRLVVASRKGGIYKGAWPPPPAWRAGEWHHLAATWSADQGRQAIYYDCILAGTANYGGLIGSGAAQFSLGGGGIGPAIDGALDDVRISARALGEPEIGRACERDGPAPNDETVLDSTQFAAGQLVTLEMTPCDLAGRCGQPASSSVTISPPPLGELSPITGVLFPGITSVALSVSTAKAADCRWSNQPGTPFGAMSLALEADPDGLNHTTTVSGLSDLDERWFYVRCQDRTGERSPDDFERSSHVRVMGPWAGGYPRLANLWGDFRPELGLEYYASHHLYVPLNWNGHLNQARAIRAVNPVTKILMTGHATYDWPQIDPMTRSWIESQPGDPYYNCVFRSSAGEVLVPFDAEPARYPMFNLTQAICRDKLLDNDIGAFLSPRADLGDNLAYDGIYWDRLYNAISWLLGPDVDGDGDGRPDDPTTLDAAYRFGVLYYLGRVRAALPQAILMANDAPAEYTPWLNGRNYEWQIDSLVEDIKPDLHWPDLTADYRAWAGAGYEPHTTLLAGATDPFYHYKNNSAREVPPAAAEAAESNYRRMRFGLATALMGDGMYAYDYGPYGPSTHWWYEEYGAQPIRDGTPPESALPAGYLGQPLGQPQLLAGELTAQQQLLNGTFESGLAGWSLWVPDQNPSQAELVHDPSGGVNGSGAAHIVIGARGAQTDVELRQAGLSTLIGQSYTLSFWARSSITRTLLINLKKDPAGENYGFFGLHATITPAWQHIYLSDVMTVTAADGKLELLMGDQSGELWLDDIQFQAGAVGVWARPFEQGLAVVNATRAFQTVDVPPGYCRLSGSQAPYFAARVDDDAAVPNGEWTPLTASARQYGLGVQVAAGGSGVTLTYRPELAFAGTYEVLAWVTPRLGQSQQVWMTVRSAQGDTAVAVDQTAGAPGWHSLGTFEYTAADLPSVILEASGSGAVVADAVAWVSTARYNNGEAVSRLMLQPQDGIILTTDCG
jgi:hypothetical protein